MFIGVNRSNSSIAHPKVLIARGIFSANLLGWHPFGAQLDFIQAYVSASNPDTQCKGSMNTMAPPCVVRDNHIRVEQEARQSTNVIGHEPRGMHFDYVSRVTVMHGNRAFTTATYRENKTIVGMELVDDKYVDGDSMDVGDDTDYDENEDDITSEGDNCTYNKPSICPQFVKYKDFLGMKFSDFEKYEEEEMFKYGDEPLPGFFEHPFFGEPFSDDESVTVVHKVKSKVQRRREFETCTPEQFDEMSYVEYLELCDQLDVLKEIRKNKFRKNVLKRKNKKEEKRRAYKSKKLLTGNDRSQVKPHGDNDVEPIPEIEDTERNEMARKATEVKPLVRDENDSELTKLLNTICETADIMRDSEGNAYWGEIDEWVGHLENLVILGYQMTKSTCYMDVFVAVAAYAKMYAQDKSMVLELYRIINEVTTTCPKEEVEPQAMSDWTGRDIMESWELFKTNTIFKRISYLITAAMSLTICTTKRIEWSPLGLQIISLEAAKEQASAVDVIDALVKTFVWVAEVGWRCFETRSFSPILYSDQKIQKYNQECDWVLAHAEAAIAGNTDDLGDFENKLQNSIKKTCQLKAARNEGPTALWLQKRYVDLTAIAEKLLAKRKNTTVRVSPIGFSLHGDTGVGKTTLGKLTMNQSLAAMEYCDERGRVDETRILTMDMFDKYQSTYTSDILGVFMDDLGNTKSEFQKENPHTSVIIKFFNNVAAQAIKAELNAKGVVFIDFKCGVVTTNVKDLDARSYSNCPESILRRFFHVEVQVKEKYCKPGTTLLNQSHPDIRNSKSLTHDVWDLKMEEVITYKLGTGKTAYKFVPMSVVLDDGSTLDCSALGLKDYLKAVIALSREHRLHQDSLMVKAKNEAKTEFCKVCKQYPDFCDCSKTLPIDQADVKPEAHNYLKQIVVDAGKKAITSYIDSWLRPVDFLNSALGFRPVRQLVTQQLADELQREINITGTPLLIALTPEWLFKTRVFQKSIAMWQGAAASYDIRRPVMMGTMCNTALILYGLVQRKKWAVGTGVIGSWSLTVVSHFVRKKRAKLLHDQYVKQRDALPEYAQKIRDGKFPTGVLFVATLTIAVKFVKLWNNRRLDGVETQAEISVNGDDSPGWFGWAMSKLGWKAEPGVMNASPVQVTHGCLKQQWWGHFTREDGSSLGCNVLCPMKGVLWMPLHIFYEDCDMSKPLQRLIHAVVFRDKKMTCSQIKIKIELGVNAVYMPGLDLVAAFVERCPDVPKNLMKHLPKTKPVGTSMSTISGRDKHMNVFSEVVTVEHCMTGHCFMDMYGGYYTTSRARSGTCMSLIIPEGKNSLIAGLHIGGTPKDNYGVMMTVTQQDAKTLHDKLFSLPGVKGLAMSTPLPETQFGRKVLSTKDVHPHAKAIHALGETAQVDVLGSTHLRNQARSRVQESVISASVEKHFKIKNQWGAPRLVPNWAAFNATLEYIVDPADMFVPSILQKARADFMAPLLEIARKENSVKPLTDKESVLGVPGKRFLDALPMNTGMGFPVFGPKGRWFTDIWKNGVLEDRIPDPAILEEVERLRACWLNGERAYPICTATLKDEPTELGKEKVRVFQAGAVAFGLQIRKYFLPIARLMSMHSFASESAVGVNAFGPEWNELMNYAEKYAEKRRMIGWDYSKYDIRMSSQMTYAALMVFYDIACELDYSEEDLLIMKNMITDMIHPVIDYNGTLIMAYNMNTSGNNITVYINDIVNSLLVRMAFFSLCPDESNFRACVAAITYGDDFIGSVIERCRDRFNFRTVKAFLAQHGMKITLPDKSNDEADDLPLESVDFLKRTSNWIPEIETRLGMLSLNSIFKSLHSNLASKTDTPREVSASCIEGAMHEIFAHGKEVYDDFQRKMKLVCIECNLPVPAVEHTFEERVKHWREKYSPKESV